MKWTTKTGEQLEVADMSTNHLRHSIRLLVRRKNSLLGEVDRLASFGGGEMAMNSASDQVDKYFRKAAAYQAIINEMDNELRRRRGR